MESLIVGWYAVAYHGYPRATEDIDDVRGVLAVQGIASLDIDSLQSWCDRHDTRELLEELITELDQQSAE